MKNHSQGQGSVRPTGQLPGRQKLRNLTAVKAHTETHRSKARGVGKRRKAKFMSKGRIIAHKEGKSKSD